MVKAYLRYESGRSLGVISSRESNVASDRTGKLALAGCVDEVVVWNIRQGVQVRALRTPKSAERVTRLCVRETGGEQQVVAVGYADGSVRLWDFETGSLMSTLQGHKSAVSCFAFDSAGHVLASGSSDTDIVLWDIVSESGIARLRGHVDQVTAVLLWDGGAGVSRAADATGGKAGSTDSPSARVISASKDRFVRIWSVEMQLCLQTIADHKFEVWSLALNASQTRLVCGSTDKFLRLYALDAEGSSTNDEGRPLASFMGAVPRTHGQGTAAGLRYVRPKAVEYDVLLCQGAGKVLEFYRCYDEEEVKKRQRRRRKRVQEKQRKKAPEGADAEEDAAAAAGAAADDGVHAADELSELPAYHGSNKAVSFAWSAKESAVLVGLANNTLETVRLAPGAEDASALSSELATCLEVQGHRTGIRSLAVAHDDSLVMSTSAEAVKIWNSTTGNCVRTMASGYGLCSVFVAGNEHVVVGTKEGHLELYDLRVADCAQKLEAHAGAVYGLAESPAKDVLVSCSADKYVRFFNLVFTRSAPGASEHVKLEEDAEKATELPDECLGVAYSANGKWIAVALLNHTVQMFFADSLKFYLSLYGHRLPVMCLDICSDSQMVATGSADKNVKLWSTQFGNCHRSLRAHSESVMQVKFLPGTHYLASAGRDRELKLWDCDSYELITALKGQATEILALALSQDAAFIATGGSDRQIRFWKRSQEQLFLSEERSKELEEQFEQEVEREDMQATTMLRPSRKTVESVRSTERLMEILDEAKEVQAGTAMAALAAQGNPCVRVMRYVNTLNASNIYEVLLALPFSYARRLLQLTSDYLDAVANLPEGGNSGSNGSSGSTAGASAAQDTKTLSAAATLETPCQAALITAYVHHAELAATSELRGLVVQLRGKMRTLLQAEKDRIGFTMAGVGHLQRVLKRSGAFRAEPAAPAPSAKAAPGGKKRRKR
eukprot:TRINITY_DN24750_c0_g2_i1.p1 TRINITY_DN24750_c0_g2~~TRINITY_DN24750_c0_g2_i1.p1  ORF type:complete len:978 (-),score=241.30 TRINITY_DN24750_c0_g2_i1:55-2901(-)